MIAGYSIIEVRSKEEAIEWVKRWPVEDGHGAAQIEIRQLYEMDDFGESPWIDRMKELANGRKK